MITAGFRQQLLALADKEYQKFSSALLPNVTNILGVRLPQLRHLAKKIAGSEWRSYLAEADNEYFEGVMLQGMVIGYAKADIEERLHYIAAFIPRIDNWSVCDSFCSSLKFTKQYQEQVWNFIQPYFSSRKQYEIRFAVVMVLTYYVEEAYIDRVLRLLENSKHEGYYAKMAVAWAVSICFVKFPDQTLDLLQHNTMDDFTYHKSLQKITESRRVDTVTKERIRRMKRDT